MLTIQLILRFCLILPVALFPATGMAEDSAIRLTNHEAPDLHCVWSPDGRYISFASLRTGELKLFVVFAGGGDVTQIETGLSGDHYNCWSPDSKYMVFDAYGPDGPPPRLWRIPSNGGEPQRILRDVVPCFHPTFSPDGEWIAFTGFQNGTLQIFKAKLDGDSLVSLTTTSAKKRHPRWSPDGTSVVFTSDRSGNDDIWIVSADGSNERQITSAPDLDDQACISPDGKLVAFVSERGGKRDIWLTSVDGGPARQFTHDGANSFPSFSPDGKNLVWSSDRDGQRDLYIGKIVDD